MSDWLDSLRPEPRIGLAGRLRIAVKGGLLVLTCFVGLLLLLALRLIERPLYGTHRPLTPWVTQGVCRLALRIIGIRLSVRGRVMTGEGALVANHASWLDIFALNAATRLYFVSKAEVASWPGIGWLARATGTVFITRKSTEARVQQQMFEERLTAGHRLTFFPEGTSTDARRILPFKSTLFAAFFSPALRDELSIQPVTVNWVAPAGEDPRFYGWWGGMEFGPHLAEVLAVPRQGVVEITFHAALKVADFADRKALTLAAEAAVRSAHPEGALRDAADIAAPRLVNGRIVLKGSEQAAP